MHNKAILFLANAINLFLNKIRYWALHLVLPSFVMGVSSYSH
jgi:hypothetical protein